MSPLFMTTCWRWNVLRKNQVHHALSTPWTVTVGTLTVPSLQPHETG
jgi:hypothetical protein